MFLPKFSFDPRGTRKCLELWIAHWHFHQYLGCRKIAVGLQLLLPTVIKPGNIKNSVLASLKRLVENSTHVLGWCHIMQCWVTSKWVPASQEKATCEPCSFYKELTSSFSMSSDPFPDSLVVSCSYSSCCVEPSEYPSHVVTSHLVTCLNTCLLVDLITRTRSKSGLSSGS